MTEPTVSLKQYIDSRLDAVREAIVKADAANEKRFDSVNEFRAQQSDIVRSTMPRSEMEQRFYSLEEKINSKNVQLVVSFVLAAVSALIAVASFASRLGG